MRRVRCLAAEDWDRLREIARDSAGLRLARDLVLRLVPDLGRVLARDMDRRLVQDLDLRLLRDSGLHRGLLHRRLRLHLRNSRSDRL